ncbi:MAG: hypothetical protein ACSI46_24105 [Gloeotrichia echinulata DVL01]|jgi:hypothetical protein|nr:hypothetical protein [Gloeotrichia echinulata DEX184]
MTHVFPANISKSFTINSVEVIQFANPHYTDHWQQRHHGGDQEWVEAYAQQIADFIEGHARRNNIGNDTKYVVNYSLGQNRYFVVIVFYRSNGDVRFHSCRRSPNRGIREAETDVVLTRNWPAQWN